MLEKYIIDRLNITAPLYRVCEEIATFFKIPVSLKLIELGKTQLKHLANRHKEIKKSTYSMTPGYKVATSLPGLEVKKSLFSLEGKYYFSKPMSMPEQQTISLLESSDKVVWWFKNFDSGKKAFSLVYKEGDEDKLHYPDFIVKTEGETLLIETKIKSTVELEIPVNNMKYQTFSPVKSLNYHMVFVDTHSKTNFFCENRAQQRRHQGV